MDLPSVAFVMLVYTHRLIRFLLSSGLDRTECADVETLWQIGTSGAAYSYHEFLLQCGCQHSARWNIAAKMELIPASTIDSAPRRLLATPATEAVSDLLRSRL